jgi:hypothetical protein
MGEKKRYKATICEKLQKKKSFKGRPTTREEELELVHGEHDEMAPVIPGAPFCYNHDGSDKVGVVVASEKTADGKWDIAFEIDGATLTGRSAQGWIESGGCREVSLAHRPGNARTGNKATPVEVSYCFKGARANTIIHSVYDSKLGKYIPLDEQSHSIQASADTSTPSFTVFLDDDDEMVEASDNPAAADAPMLTDEQKAESAGGAAPATPAAPAAPAALASPADEDDEKDESMSKGLKDAAAAGKKAVVPEDDPDLDIKNINRLRESLEKSTNLTKADRIALQNTITTSAMRYSKTQEQLQVLAAKLRGYEEKELAARESKLAQERAEMEKEAEKHRKIIGDFYRQNSGNPLAEKAVQACKDKSTTNAMLEVYASSCVLASASEPARMSPAIAAEWQRHVAEREAAKRSKPAAAVKRPIVAASTTSATTTTAAAATTKQVNASAMDTTGDGSDEEQEDDYFENAGLVRASASGKRYILGDPLEYPPEFLEDDKGVVFASAAPTSRQLSRMTDYQRRQALEYSRRTFTPWTKGTGARFNMHDIPDRLKADVAKLWCSFPGGTGFNGNGANVYRRTDHCSPATINASRDNVDLARQALDMQEDAMSEWAKKVSAVGSSNRGQFLPS